MKRQRLFQTYNPGEYPEKAMLLQYKSFPVIGDEKNQTENMRSQGSMLTDEKGTTEVESTAITSPA